MSRQSTDRTVSIVGQGYRGEHRKSTVEAEREAFFAVLRGIRRNIRLILSITLLGTAAITAVVLFAITPQFRAVTTILVDASKTDILKDREVVGRQGNDASAIENEVELIQSPSVLRKVAAELNLHDDPEYSASGGLAGWIKWVLLAPFQFSAVTSDGEEGEVDRLTRIVEALKGRIRASRRNQTHVIEVSAWSGSADKAARIANKIADVYLAEQIGAKSETTRHATRWLNDEVGQLRSRLETSENAYETYKAQAGLFNPGGLNLADRQIAQLNEQLVMARARAAEAEAKYRQLEQINADNLETAASSPDTLQSAVLSNLRNHYADAARKHAELTARYGARHPQVIGVKAELDNLGRQIGGELERIVASARTEVEMARSRQQSLSSSLDELKVSAASLNQKAVKLRELEREVQANKALFEAFLARAKETSAELSLNLPDARILSVANDPLSPSYPRKGMMIGFGFFGSLSLGLFISLAQSLLTEGFRRASDLQSAFGLTPLATIPYVEPQTSQSLMYRNGSYQRAAITKLTRVPPEPVDLESCRIANLVVSEPHSAFAESVHSLRFALKQTISERGMSVVLVTSALPGEGKSTVAINIARAASMYSERVLLIDADLRRPSVAAKLRLPPMPGLVRAARGDCDPQEAIIMDEATPLHLMAGVTRLSGPEALSLLASVDFATVMSNLRKIYDLIIVDTSPLLAVSDTRFLLEQCDGVALVVASQKTGKTALKSAIEGTPGLESKLIGGIINRVTGDMLGKYENYNNLSKIA
jgi:capsular exopolysaccharide synthesis family protein